MLCQEIMKYAVEFAREESTAKQAAEKMRDAKIGFLPVLDERGRVVGVLTDRDIALRVCGESRSADETPVGEIMSREIVSCRPEDPLSKAEELMVKHYKARIVMTDSEGKLLGLISLTDVAQYEEPLRAARIVRQVGAREFRFGR
jgi:CBS domain-containing protein